VKEGEDGDGARISALRADILALDMRLAVIASHRDGSDGRGGAQRSHSPPPWNAAAALCRMDLHALAREIECRWREMAGFPALARGGSDGNTRAALRALENLCEARGVDTRGGVTDLERWTRGARMTLGDLERPRRIAGDIACPFCSGRTLRMIASRGIVVCVNPNCRTSDGAHPQARMEYVAASDEVELVWGT
jgi:hypothetical protein